MNTLLQASALAVKLLEGNFGVTLNLFLGNDGSD